MASLAPPEIVSSETIIGDTDAALGFIKRYFPGLIALTAIDPESTPERPIIDGRTFDARTDEKAIRAFVANWNGRRNLYYTANSPRVQLRKPKLKEADIFQVRALYGDVDPEPGRTFDDERDRLQAQGRELLEHPAVPPTLVIDSGGGIQPLWVLEEPIEATPETREAAKAQGRGIAAAICGDSVQSLDHLLRLPGTVNLPTSKKLQDFPDREPTVARVLGETGRRYALENLAAFAEPVAAPESTGGDGADLDLDMGLIRSATTYDELPLDLRSRFDEDLRRIDALRARWGGDGAGLKDTSRSGFDFAVAGILKTLRSYTPTEIGQVLWVYEHGRGGTEDFDERHVRRCIGRAAQRGEVTFEPLPEDWKEWDAERIQSEARGLLAVREHDIESYSAKRDYWHLFDVLSADAADALVDGALGERCGVDLLGLAERINRGPGQLKSEDVRRQLAELQQADRVAYDRLRELAADAPGAIVGRRDIDGAAKAGESARKRDRLEAERRESGKKIVQYRPDLLVEVVDQVQATVLADERHDRVLAYAGGLVTVREGQPVTVAQMARRGEGELPPMPLIRPYDSASILERCMKSVRFEQEIGEGEIKPIRCPEVVATTLLARRGDGVPALTGVVEGPTLREDGSPLEAPGYDRKTGLFAVFDPERFLPVPGAPTAEDARESHRYLADEFLADFPFAEPVDRDVALAALLTGLVRRILPGTAPAFLLSAPTQGTGKTALAEAVFHAAFGRPPAAHAYPTSEEESNKVIVSTLREGQGGVVFDNILDGTVVRNAALAAALTTGSYSSRLLGQNTTVSLPTNILWMLTGNNISLAGDLPSRVLECYLDSRVERPDQRRFSRELVPWVAAHRARIVQAGLTIIRAYLLAGAPLQAETPSRFHAWDRMVRFPLMFAGAEDVRVKFDSAVQEDPGLVLLRETLETWHALFASEPKTAGELFTALNDVSDGRTFDGSMSEFHQRFSALVDDGRGSRLTQQGIGRRLKQYVNRPVGGHVLCSRHDSARKTHRYFVKISE